MHKFCFALLWLVQHLVWIRQLFPSSDLGIGCFCIVDWLSQSKRSMLRGGERRAKGTYSAFLCHPASATWHFCSVSCLEVVTGACWVTRVWRTLGPHVHTRWASTLNAGPQLSEPYFFICRTKMSSKSQGSWEKWSKEELSSLWLPWPCIVQASPLLCGLVVINKFHPLSLGNS